jgi:hypothetical protein
MANPHTLLRVDINLNKDGKSRMIFYSVIIIILMAQPFS